MSRKIIRRKPQNQKSMIDLFAGTGAFTSAFEKMGAKCVFANDLADESQEIYDLNFSNKSSNHKLTNGDLNDIDVKTIPTHDILCGGFPCQPFSIAGQRKGFNDKRSNVFWKILEIIEHHKPQVFILENVKNLQTHDNGKTFETIYDNLVKIGYHIKFSVLNTCQITSVPQNRERIYIVGFSDIDLFDKFDFNFPIKILRPVLDFLESNVDVAYYYDSRYKVFPEIVKNVTKMVKDNVIYQYRRHYVRENKNSVCPTLTANMGGGGHNVPLIRDNKGIRKLTPRECFNLQGFPASYKLPDLSDNKLYKLAGNAVSVPVVELIARKIMNILN